MKLVLEWNYFIQFASYKQSLREKCPNTELFLVRIWTLSTQWILPESLLEHFDRWKNTCFPLLIAFSYLSDINTTLKIGITLTRSFTLCYVIATTWCWKRYITMSLQCQYVIGLYHDENPTKNWCRYNIVFPPGGVL